MTHLMRQSSLLKVNFLVQDAEPIPFPSEVLDDAFGQPDTPKVIQVDHVVHWLRSTPLAELVSLNGGEGGGLSGPHSEPMEVRGGNSSILRVKVFDPCVQIFQILQVVSEVMGTGTIALKPNEFGGVKNGSDG